MTTNDKAMYEAAEAGRRRLLHGTFLASWRTQGRRRVLVCAVALSLLAYCIGVPIHLPVVTVAGLLLFGLAAVMLRLVTRGVADLPAAALDERQIAVRNFSYLVAYRLLGGAVATIVSVIMIFRLAGAHRDYSDWLEQVLLTLVFFSLAAPSCVVGWMERED